MILVFNKTDVKDAEFAHEWMTDFEAFQAALRSEEDAGTFEGGPGVGGGGGSGYMGSLLNSMSLMLEEFYRHLSVVGVSSMTGKGVPEFFEAVKEKAAEYERDYKPELERRQKERQEEKKGRREKELAQLMKDVNVKGSSSTASPGSKGKSAGGLRKAQLQKDKANRQGETLSDLEDEMEDDIPAEMVEPDEDEDYDNTEDAEDGGAGTATLTHRYKKALNDEGGGGGGGTGGLGDEASFAKYLSSQTGRS